MEAAITRIFGEITDVCKTMGGLHKDYLSLVRRDIDHFLEKTKDLNNQYYWQGYTTLGLTILGASCAIAGGLIPKAASDNATTVNSRLGANDGPSNVIKAITDKLKDNDFLRSTCKTASKAFDGVRLATDAWFKSTTTDIDSKRLLLRDVNIGNEQTQKTTVDSQVERAQQAVLKILDLKAKGG